MSFRFKSALAHLIALAAMGIGWFTYMPWAIVRAAPLPEIASAGAGILLFGNGFLYLYLRTLRCPHCTTRFGPRMYKSGLMHLPWPREDCWHCGTDLGKEPAEGSPAKAEAARPHGFPLRWRAVLVLIVVWNALGIASMFMNEDTALKPGPTMALGLIFLLFVSWATKHLDGFQHFILAEGHSVGEIRRLLTFVQAFALLGLLGLLGFEVAGMLAARPLS
jgi:hypothetical protein